MVSIINAIFEMSKYYIRIHQNLIQWAKISTIQKNLKNYAAQEDAIKGLSEKSKKNKCSRFCFDEWGYYI